MVCTHTSAVALAAVIAAALVSFSHAGAADEFRERHRNAQLEMAQETVSNLREHLASNPNDPSAWFNLASTLQSIDMQTHRGKEMQMEALSAFKKALSLQGVSTANVDTYLRMGVLQNTMGKVEDAIVSFTRGLSEAEDDGVIASPPHASRSCQANEAGQCTQAVQDFLFALHFNPLQPSALQGLVAAKKEDPEAFDLSWEELSRLVDEAVNMASNGNVTNTNTVMTEEAVLSNLHFAKFAIDHQVKAYDSAWHHLQLGNSYEKAWRAPFNPQDERDRMARVKAVFSGGFFSSSLGLFNERTPVFIIGMPRSGSTLVEQILHAHSRGFGIGEVSVLNSRLLEVLPAIIEATEDGAKAVQEVLMTSAESIVKEMVQRVPRKQRGQVTRIIDKMLFNYRNVGLIHLLFPDAAIIHTMRNPMDTVFSIYKLKFDDSGLEWTHDLDHIVEVYRLYWDIMQHWDEVLPNRILHVPYEALVSDQKRMTKKILDHVGLRFEKRTLDFHKSKRAVHTHSMEQVRQQIYTHAVDAWKKYEKHLRPWADKVAAITGPYNPRFDYGQDDDEEEYDDENDWEELDAEGW